MQYCRILLIEDDSELRSALFRVLERRGYEVLLASSCGEALSIVKSERAIDLVLVDLRLPDGSGTDLIGQIKASQSDARFIVISGFATIDEAVVATQKGASHFITKPIDIDQLLSRVESILTLKSMNESKVPRHQKYKKFEFDNIIGQSPALLKVLDLIERVADSDSTVLIVGESGTGKELVARAIHYNSLRMEKAFVPVNCCAIPRDLLESELFGHVKGSFTGALTNRMGRFELAHGGTLFLDEIGDMEPNLQIKLLRVLQEKRFEPVGSTRSVESNARIIAATNVDLEKAVAQGKFREDLFYRLNVIPIKVPSLRERVTDIPLLLRYYVNYFNQSKNRKISGFSDEALRALISYRWPGNIRELENFVERVAIIKGEGEIQITDLCDRMRGGNHDLPQMESVADIPEMGLDFNSAVDAYENALISSALKRTGWNRNRAATLLGLNRTTLVEKIKKKGLKPPEAGA